MARLNGTGTKPTFLQHKDIGVTVSVRKQDETGQNYILKRDDKPLAMGAKGWITPSPRTSLVERRPQPVVQTRAPVQTLSYSRAAEGAVDRPSNERDAVMMKMMKEMATR